LVKVIGGLFKGRKLKTIEGLKTRPTPSIVREAIFDILAEKIEGANFLDLYAGFGCVGIEALSRGAAFVLFVEEDFKISSVIKENLGLFGINAKGQVLTIPVFKSLKKISFYNIKYDFIFLDPPYLKTSFKDFFELLSESNILSREGEVIIQHSRKVEIVLTENYLQKKRYNYGDTSLSFIRRKGSEDET